MIELLVVISIIALLIGILLPALASAREAARGIQCASGMRQVAVAFNTYATDNKDYFPPSYVYPEEPWDGQGNGNYTWSLDDNVWGSTNDVNGYVHWSWALFSGGTLEMEAFQCPTMAEGGMPATNSRVYSRFEGYDSGLNSGGAPGTIDRQVDVLAFAGNEMVMPRNKFGAPTSGSRERDVVLARASNVNMAATILMTEFVDNVGTIANSGGFSKSHRPIMPIYSALTGATNYETITNWNAGRDVLDLSDSTAASDYRLTPYDELKSAEISSNIGFAKSSTSTSTNGVGRHHAGGRNEIGAEGTANFTRVDGSTYRTTVRDVMENNEWGPEYYTVTGKQKINYLK